MTNISWTSKTKAVIYARFSPRPDAKDCEGIEAQINMCVKFCREKGWEVVEAFFDKSKSGGDEDRPGLWHAVKMARDLKCKLVVWRHDRLVRGVMFSEILHQKLEKYGAELVAVNGLNFNSTPEGQMIRRILSAVDEYERRILSVRSSAFRREYISQGRYMGGLLPIGKQLDPKNPKRMIDNRKELAMIAKIRDWRKQGLYIGAITALLADTGYHKRNGKKWTEDEVIKFIGKEVVAKRLNKKLKNLLREKSLPENVMKFGADGLISFRGAILQYLTDNPGGGTSGKICDEWNDRVRTKSKPERERRLRIFVSYLREMTIKGEIICLKRKSNRRGGRGCVMDNWFTLPKKAFEFLA